MQGKELRRTGADGRDTTDTRSWGTDAEAPSCRPLPGHYRNKHFTPAGASGSTLMAHPGGSLVHTVLGRIPNLTHSNPTGAWAGLKCLVIKYDELTFLINIVCVFMCVRVNMYVQVRVHLCARACGGQKTTLSVASDRVSSRLGIHQVQFLHHFLYSMNLLGLAVMLCTNSLRT